MTKACDTEAELFVFLDSNIVLEGKPLANLPWEHLANEGIVRVLIVPKAMEEIDAKKRDGRLGQYARSFNRLIAPAVISGEPVIIREAAPRVELEMTTCSPIPWEAYDELDPNDGDSRIVAEALHARRATSDNRRLISHDIKPLIYARGRDLPVYKASDDWLRDPEPSPQDKQIQRLKQQVSDLRKDEPDFEIVIDVSESDPLEIYQVAKLDEMQAEELLTRLKKENPRKQQRFEQPFATAFDSFHDHSYESKYGKFVSKTLPSYISRYHEKLELLFNQRSLEVRVTNTGLVRADHLVVLIETNQAWLNRRIVAPSPAGPVAPTPRPSVLEQPIVNPTSFLRDIRPARIGRHEFEITIPANRSKHFEATCENFRSGQAFVFEGVVLPTSEVEALEITVRLAAKNLRGERKDTLHLEKQMVQVDASDLVDMDHFKLRRSYPVQAEIMRLTGDQDYDGIDWDNEAEG